MKRYVIIFAFALAAMLQACWGAGYEMIRDLSYRDSAGTVVNDDYARERCRLDVYYPVEVTDAPVVVWFHGGGLTGGAKVIPQELKDAGYVVVGVNYRLLPKVRVDECIDDAAAAVAWTFRNIAGYNGSPKKIFVAGHSAGGYLTSMVGLDRSYLSQYGVDADSIAGLLPFSGQAITHYAHRDMEGIGPLQPTVDRYAPLFHVRGDSAPYIIITGDRDSELFGRCEENAYMWRMMKLAGHPDVQFFEIAGHDHGAMAHPAFHILRGQIARILAQKQL